MQKPAGPSSLAGLDHQDNSFYLPALVSDEILVIIDNYRLISEIVEFNCHPERTEPDLSGELMTEGNNIVEGQ